MSFFLVCALLNLVYRSCFDLIICKVADPAGFYPHPDPAFEEKPDPTFEKKKSDPDPTVKKKTGPYPRKAAWSRTLPNFDLDFFFRHKILEEK